MNDVNYTNKMWNGRTILLLEEVFYELWKWLSLNPLAAKEDWPGWEKNGGRVPRLSANCPACEACGMHCEEKSNFCPINHPENENCDCANGMFRTWQRTPGMDTETKSVLAKKISELPWHYYPKNKATIELRTVWSESVVSRSEYKGHRIGFTLTREGEFFPLVDGATIDGEAKTANEAVTFAMTYVDNLDSKDEVTR